MPVFCERNTEGEKHAKRDRKNYSSPPRLQKEARSHLPGRASNTGGCSEGLEAFIFFFEKRSRRNV